MPFAPPAPLTSSAWRSTALVALACGALLGCHPHAHNPTQGGSDPTLRVAADTGGAEAGYLAPPRLVSVLRAPTTVLLMGSAPPGARVEMMAPEGETMSTQANATGAWRLTLPAVTRPRMFALAARLKDQPSGGRVVHAEGALILLPHAGPPALLVRAGAGALVFDTRTVRPSLDALDYDPGGFSAAAGRARPGASVSLMLDGALAGIGKADVGGRFSILAANRRLQFGTHDAVVQSADGQDEQRFTIAPPDSTLTTAYKVDPIPDGWRLEWVLSDGGVQTTLVFIPAD